MTNTTTHTINDTDYAVVAVIVGVHGVKGLVKVKTFTENPDSVFDYTLFDKDGQAVELVKMSVSKGTFIAKFNSITDRDVATSVKGTELFMQRSELPVLGDDEYYHSDLIGMTVVLSDNAPFGVVSAMHNFGAGDLVEVVLNDTMKSEVFHFEQDVVSIDVDANIMSIEPPVYVETEGDK